MSPRVLCDHIGMRDLLVMRTKEAQIGTCDFPQEIKRAFVVAVSALLFTSGKKFRNGGTFIYEVVTPFTRSTSDLILTERSVNHA